MYTLDEVQEKMECLNKELKWNEEVTGVFELTNYLTEEVGELSREVRRFEVGRNRPDEPGKAPNLNKMKEEIGDVLFALVDIANYYNISLEEAFNTFQNKIALRYSVY